MYYNFIVIVKDEDWRDEEHYISVEADDLGQAQYKVLDIAYELAGYTGFYTVYRA